MLFILYFSLEPQIKPTNNLYNLDKLVHFGAYFVSALLFTIAFSHIPRKNIALMFFSFGFCMEIAQLFIETRSFSVADLMANLAGILLAIYLYKAYLTHFFNNKS